MGKGYSPIYNEEDGREYLWSYGKEGIIWRHRSVRIFMDCTYGACRDRKGCKEDIRRPEEKVALFFVYNCMGDIPAEYYIPYNIFSHQSVFQPYKGQPHTPRC